jgi:peptidyl-prolyl cis-trans isomerase C
MTVFSLSGRLLTSPIKIFGICAAIVGACASITAHAQDDNIAKVVATIDGEDISLNLVIAMMRQLPPQYRDQPFDVLYDPVLDDIIDTRLAAREAKRSGIADDPLIQELAQRAYDRVMAEAWISINIQQQITDDMVDARYAELINDTSAREEISARHILVDSMDAATDIIRRLDDGEDFATLAKALSTGPSAPNGGNLGYFKRGDMVPSFSDAAFDLDVSKYTDTPVRSDYGWHVIMVEDKRTIDLPPLENIRGQLIEIMTAEQATMQADNLYQKAKIRRLGLDQIMDNAPAPEKFGQKA